MYGIEIGKVEKLSMDQENAKAVVQLSIKNDVKIYGDAIASIKTEGLIGDSYVSIDPGGAEERLAPGGTILETQSAHRYYRTRGQICFWRCQRRSSKSVQR